MSGHAGLKARTRDHAPFRARRRPPGDSLHSQPADVGDTEPEAEGKSLRRRRVRRVAMGFGAALVLVLVVSVAFCFVTWRRVDRIHVDFPGSPPGGTTYLLIGSDSRAFVKSASDRVLFGAPSAAEGERADIILLVRTLSGGGMRVLGIPRDLVTQLPAGAPIRVTQTLLSGPQTVVDTLCQSLGIGVDHLVIVHFDGLRRLVDAAGGITISAPTKERDLVALFDADHPGANRLDGSQALAYVRSRHMESFVNGSWVPVPPTAAARSDHAREVLAQLGARLHLSPTSPIGSIEKLWALSGAVTVDAHTSPFLMRDLAHRLGALGGAARADLPVTFHTGEIPTAFLTRGAASVLTQFQGGAQPGCSLRTTQTSETPPQMAASQSPGGTP